MNFSEWLTLVGLVGGGIFSILGWSIWASWWLSKQFAQTRQLVWDRGNILQSGIEAKLEYHEQHDDKRFAAVTNDLWAIRVRNAARDGELLDPRVLTSDRNK